MAKPYTHSLSSADFFGGQPEDYLKIHEFLDSSKSIISDKRHRALTHNSWFISTVLEKVFGVNITNSDGKQVSVRDIGERHVLEDFNMKFIPSAQDYLQEIQFQEWMDNGKDIPNSYKKLAPPEKLLTPEYIDEKKFPMDGRNMVID